MADIFASDFNDFIAALNISETEYIIVGGYAVILHGYYRTTNDLNVWVNKTPANHLKLRKAFAIFGMSLFDMTLENFMSEEFDVFSMGRMPLQIDIITKLKGLAFTEAMQHAEQKEIEGLKVSYVNLTDLIKAKTASGRHKDLDDIEKLSL